MYRLLSIAAFLVPVLWGIGLVMMPNGIAISYYIIFSMLTIVGVAMSYNVWKQGADHDE